jgi:hypothetical protein
VGKPTYYSKNDGLRLVFGRKIIQLNEALVRWENHGSVNFGDFPAGHVHAKFVGCFNAQSDCSWSIDTSIG